MTIQTAVLIETLKELGADIRWVSCNIYSTQDHAAAAIAAAGIPVFAYKGETLKEYWELHRQAVSTGTAAACPNMILDDGGDATMLVHLGLRAENGDVGLPRQSGCGRRAVSLRPDQAPPQKEKAPRAGSARSPSRSRVSRKRPPRVCTVSTSWPRKAKLLFPAINVNDSVTKSKFDNLYGCRESLVDGSVVAPT